jgi:hypothetical protein
MKRDDPRVAPAGEDPKGGKMERNSEFCAPRKVLVF